MVSNSANMICGCEWALLPSHSECFLVSDTRGVDVAKQSQVQDVRQQQCFLAHLKDSFDFTSWGRCWEVSCFFWPMRDVSCLLLLASWRVCVALAWGFHLWRTGEKERYERVTGEKQRRGNRRAGESVLVKRHFHSTCLCVLPSHNLWMSRN